MKPLQDYIICKLIMQQPTEKDTSVAFERLPITPETQKHGNEPKELTTFNTKFFTAIEILCKEKKKCPDTNLYLSTLKRMN